MAFYDESDSVRQEGFEESELRPNLSSFFLSEEQKNNLIKRLPSGFSLIRKSDAQHSSSMNKMANDILIEYTPRRRQYKIDLNSPIASVIEQTIKKKESQNENKPRMIAPSMQGRNRQMEKIKNIIQRFRKHPKYGLLANFLSKIGLLQILNEIQTENKKGLLTIDTFRQRFMLVLESARNVTYEEKSKQVIDQMIEQLLCYAEQARKVQFENSIQSIQKSIDKITRYVSQSNWYIRKRKKGDKVDNNYTEKQIMYIGDLIRKLPPAYLIGVMEIIEERTIAQCGEEQTLTIKLNELTNRKLKDVQVYVKGKISLLSRSRERKAQKIRKKRARMGDEENQENQENDDKADLQQKEGKNAELGEESQQGSEYEFFKGMKKNIGDDDELLISNRQISNEFFEAQNQLQMEKSEKQVKIDSSCIKQEVKEGKKKEDEAKDKIEKEALQKQQSFISEDSSMDQNDSSDSSMITDQDESDF